MFNGECVTARPLPSTPHPQRRPSRTEELLAGAYKKCYRHNFTNYELVGQIENQMVAWSHELVGQTASREMFRVAQLGVALGIEVGMAIGQKKSFDDCMAALRERFPHYNLNFPL